MKSTNNLDLLVGNTEIPISVYSAIEQETHLKQVSVCCNSPVSYKKVCSGCSKELDVSEIKKALSVGDTLKEIDIKKLKVENTSFQILGLVEDCEENGVFHNGQVWFIGIQKEKSRDKLHRTITKFSYLRECLKQTNLNLIGLVNVRGKEHIVILKPYFNAFVGLGVYHFDRIRDIKEISLYGEGTEINQDTLKQMSEQLKLKERVAIKQIENTRNRLLEIELSKKEMGGQLEYAKKEENPLEIISF